MLFKLFVKIVFLSKKLKKSLRHLTGLSTMDINRGKTRDF